MNPAVDTLVVGWGNPGRGDDGLGPEFVRRLEELCLPRIATDVDYQLQVEDAAEIARYRRVVFVDADRRGDAPFWLDRIEPQENGLSFSTHSVSPAAVLALARDLFQAEPEAWILGIRGYDFDEFDEQLSEGARSNVDQALEFMKTAVCAGAMERVRSRVATTPITKDHEGEICQTTNP